MHRAKTSVPRFWATRVTVVGLASLALFIGARDGGPRSGSATSVFAQPASRAPGAAVPLPDALVPGEDGFLTIPAAALERGEPVTVRVPLSPEEIGPRPMTARLRTGGVTYPLGEAILEAGGGAARLAIAADRLPPGQHFLLIRVADDSWNPNRRVAITVAAN